MSGISSGGLIRHETVARPAYIDQTRWVMDGLPQLMDMPLREFLRLTRICLIALRLSDKGLVTHHVSENDAPAQAGNQTK